MIFPYVWCPYGVPTVSLPFFFVKLKPTTVSLPFFLGGLCWLTRKMVTFVMLSGWDLLKSAFNHALFLEAVVGYQSTWCSQECWVSFCFNLSYKRTGFFFCTDFDQFWPIYSLSFDWRWSSLTPMTYNGSTRMSTQESLPYIDCPEGRLWALETRASWAFGKRTWQCIMDSESKMYFVLEIGIWQCHVSSPECKVNRLHTHSYQTSFSTDHIYTLCYNKF